ncbi:hypothetical protein GCM10023192_72860 [Amycolatopsis samaneae]
MPVAAWAGSALALPPGVDVATLIVPGTGPEPVSAPGDMRFAYPRTCVPDYRRCSPLTTVRSNALKTNEGTPMATTGENARVVAGSTPSPRPGTPQF